MQHKGTGCFGSFAQIVNGSSVNFKSFLLFLFCFIHRGIGSTIDDVCNIIFADKFIDGLFVTNIQFVNIGKKIPVLRTGVSQHPDLIAQLAITSGYKNVTHYLIKLFFKIGDGLFQTFPELYFRFPSKDSLCQFNIRFALHGVIGRQRMENDF